MQPNRLREVVESHMRHKQLLWAAKAVIEKIGTTGAEEMRTIQAAKDWLKLYEIAEKPINPQTP